MAYIEKGPLVGTHLRTRGNDPVDAIVEACKSPKDEDQNPFERAPKDVKARAITQEEDHRRTVAAAEAAVDHVRNLPKDYITPY